jgi:hypothetical protein
MRHESIYFPIQILPVGEKTGHGAFSGGHGTFIKFGYKQRSESQESQVYIIPNYAGMIPKVSSPETYRKGGK